MNEVNVKKLGDWLRAGAPGVIFDIWCPTVGGTACGIAGAAFLMKHAEDAGGISLDEMSRRLPAESWGSTERQSKIRSTATAWLGINPGRARQLYNPGCAPDDCAPFRHTPQQAADALDRAANDTRPWEIQP